MNDYDLYMIVGQRVMPTKILKIQRKWSDKPEIDLIRISALTTTSLCSHRGK